MFLPFTEGLAPFRELSRISFPVIAFNGLIAFSLNVVGAMLIDSAGSLVLTLSGVLKVCTELASAHSIGHSTDHPLCRPPGLFHSGHSGLR